MHLKHVTLAALLLGNVTPAPVPNPQPEPAPVDVGLVASATMRGLMVCAVPYFIVLRQQGLNQAKMEDMIKSADKNWEEKLKEATSLEDKWEKDRKEKEKDKKKAAADAQGQASSSSGLSSSASSIISPSLEGTVNDPRCPNAFTAYWKSQRANLESAYVRRPTPSSFNPVKNRKVTEATEQCKTNLLTARSKFALQYNMYRRRHRVTGVPLEEWDVRVDPQTEADLDKAIKEGCDYIVTGVEPPPLPDVAAPASPPLPPTEQGNRQEQVPLLPISESSRRGGQQQQPTAPIPQGRLNVAPPKGKQKQIPPPPRGSGPSTQQSPIATNAGSSGQNKLPLTPPGSPKQSSSRSGTPKKQDQSGPASAAQNSKGKGKQPAGTTQGSLMRTFTGLGGKGSTLAAVQGGGRPASLGGGAAGDKQPAPLTKADRRKTG
ncbi:hypothetical protein PspLS_10324 [Pyricularia sp. CBS 133598]|nr:hypothetical protein PspLS_10324 [Pyricularia sp. CBS 133598]